MKTTNNPNIWTEKAWDQFDPEVEALHGPPNNQEHYVSPTGQRLYITTDEREEFEQDTGFSLDADTLDEDKWNRLIEWLKDGDSLQADEATTDYIAKAKGQP